MIEILGPVGEREETRTGFLILLVKVFEVQVDSVSHSRDEGEEQGLGRELCVGADSRVSVVKGGW